MIGEIRKLENERKLWAFLKVTNLPQTTLKEQEQYEQKGEETVQKIPPELSKPVSKDMLVLAELHRGTRNFESVLKNTGLEREELNSILEDLEKKGLVRMTG